jgi:hypothetical protein
MTGCSAICLVSTMSDSETVAPSPALPPSPALSEASEPICFRLPAAVVTRSEMRKHVLAEVILWLTGPVLSAAQAVEVEDEEEEGGAVGQLLQIAAALKNKDAASVPTERSVALAAAAAVTAETIQRFLLDSEAKPVDEVEDLMMDYVDEITVDGEQTLHDLWNYSPFEALREAPPLTDEEDEEDEDAEDREALVPNNLVQFLQMPLTFKVPVGALVAVVAVVVAYLFLVAVVVYKKH